MRRDWLWDRRTSLRKIRRIFKNTQEPEYDRWAALLLSRKNVPKEVFREYLDPIDFCRKWIQIKRIMRKDSWNNPRIEFWQAVYENLLEKYRGKGKQILIRQKKKIRDELCRKVGKLIKNLRKKMGFTQKILAEKLGVSQQIVSRIEKGYENISLVTLGNIAKKLGVRVRIKFEE